MGTYKDTIVLVTKRYELRPNLFTHPHPSAQTIFDQIAYEPGNNLLLELAKAAYVTYSVLARKVDGKVVAL